MGYGEIQQDTAIDTDTAGYRRETIQRDTGGYAAKLLDIDSRYRDTAGYQG